MVTSCIYRNPVSLLQITGSSVDKSEMELIIFLKLQEDKNWLIDLIPLIIQQ
jgi:hypothetical protein